MSYILGLSQNPLSVAERYYGVDPRKVQFTVFTSCIGMVALSGGKMYGLHLVLATQDFFSQKDSDDVIAFFKRLGRIDSSAVVGSVDIWRDNLGPLYTRTISCLPSPLIFQGGDGIYGAVNQSGKVLPYKAKADEFGNLYGNVEYADGSSDDGYVSDSESENGEDNSAEQQAKAEGYTPYTGQDVEDDSNDDDSQDNSDNSEDYDDSDEDDSQDNSETKENNTPNNTGQN